MDNVYKKLEDKRRNQRNANRRYHYGVTPEDVLTMFVEQDGRCAICRKKFVKSEHKRAPNVDHSHTSGKVRGLLCHHCNVMLGHAKDNIETLAKAIIYLEKNNEPKKA